MKVYHQTVCVYLTKLVVIAVHAPTNEPGNEGDTEAFYQSLQSVIAHVPSQEMLLLVDFNARVGNDSKA